MKKYILAILACFMFSSCVNENKDSGEVEVKFEKGNGNIFFNEPVNIGGESYYVHHSTMKCPAINNGVQTGCYKLDPYHNLFCPICMDMGLIAQFNSNYFPQGYKN